MSMPDIGLMRQGVDWFWPDAPANAFLVLSWKHQGDFCSRWFRMADLAAFLVALFRKARVTDTYVGMGLRHPHCQPIGRGTSEDVYAIGALWIECDHTAGIHRTRHLPTPFQLTAFLRTLPFVSSLQIDFPIGGFSPPEGRLARGFKPPAFSRFLFQSAVKSAESF
jgi:hypothetical protein